MLLGFTVVDLLGKFQNAPLVGSLQVSEESSDSGLQGGIEEILEDKTAESTEQAAESVEENVIYIAFFLFTL